MPELLEQEKCPKCQLTVYDAEGFPAGGRRFHKRCFKCSTCSKKLDSTTVRTHGEALFCRACHIKLVPNQSPKIYADTTVIKPKDGKGCPRCGGAVYEAEKLTVKDEVYHKRCFTCKRCTRPMDSLMVTVAPADQDIYCNVCLKIVTAPDRPTVNTDTTIIMGSGDVDIKDSCPRCGGKVFEAEKMTGKFGYYHKKCFKCLKCKRPLDYQTLSEGPDNEVYCKNCYSYEHGHKSKPNLHDSDVTIIQGTDGEQDVCPRCNGKVFEAEKQIAKPGSYHRKCFTCVECKHQMDPRSFANGPDNEIYCLFCYEKTHGKKAKTKSMPLDTTSIQGEEELGTCPRCCGKVFAAERMVAASGYYHRHCFRCSFCAQPLDSTSVCDGPDNKVYCRVCYKKLRGSSKPRFYDESAVATHTIQGKENEKACPRCNGLVFPAEKMVSLTNWYHKKCFSCIECCRPMDQFIACDSPEGEVVCSQCYKKKYSCSAYNMSGGDMLKFLSTTTIMAEDGDIAACPRCNGKVFHNERVVTKGKSYHKKCALCKTCEKNIGTKDICDGKDGDIYCKSCYARKYGAPGYRGAGAGDWTDAGSAETLRPHTTTDLSVIKGDEKDDSTCGRCKGKTFEMERKLSKTAAWHTKCYCCAKCAKPFQNYQYVYEGSDKEIYCKLCFKKTFPESEMPLTFADTTKIAALTDETACPRCHGAVFSAEQMEIKGKLYHKKCMTCKNCTRPISIDILAIGPDEDLYCTICCVKMSWPGRYTLPVDTSVIPGESGERESCPKCNGKVFEAEKMITKRGLYHKKCFACIKCRHQLDYFLAIEGPDDEVYCRVCYGRYYGPGGRSQFGDNTIFPTDESDEDSCFRCKGKVFEAEKVVAKCGPYHKHCLNCFECHGNLDAGFFNGPEGEIFCKHCYAVQHGHKAKSEYKGWMDSKTIMGSKGDSDACPRCDGKVFEAEKCPTKVGPFHKNCFSCIECNRKLDSVICCEGPDGEIYCKSCYAYFFGSKSRSRSRATKVLGPRARNVGKFYDNDDDMLARSTIETWVIKGEKDSQDCCPKCEGKVFEAEKMVTAVGKWYHKNCFKCNECRTVLDSLKNNDGPDGNLYCKMCYTKNYGPQNRPSDIDQKARNTGLIKSENEAKNCPRCGGGVYSAEEIRSKNHSYHKKCATCLACEQPLTFNTVYDGGDDIYCKFCYHRKFAPSGYRGAGCSNWVDGDSNIALKHSFQAF